VIPGSNKSKKYYTTYVLRSWVSEVHMTVKMCKESNDHTISTLHLQWVLTVPLSISRQTAVQRIAFSQTRVNILAIVTAAWRKCCHETFNTPGNECINNSVRCHHRTNSISWASSTNYAGALSCWNHNLCLTAWGTSSCNPGINIYRKLQHRAVSLSGSKWGPHLSHTVPVKQLTLMQTWFPSMWIVWRLSHAQK
jgi:hypothetical protein